MELGNWGFGNSRGPCPVDRSLQDDFWELLQMLGFDESDLWSAPEGWSDAPSFGHTNGNLPEVWA